MWVGSHVWDHVHHEVRITSERFALAIPSSAMKYQRNVLSRHRFISLICSCIVFIDMLISFGLTCIPLPTLLSVSSFQIFVFFVCVTVAAVNAQWFGQLTSEIMADMHMIEQACGLGQDIGLSSNREAYSKLCERDPKYKQLSNRLWLYHLLSSFCNLCCIVCNGYSLYYLAENLTTLWFSVSSFLAIMCPTVRCVSHSHTYVYMLSDTL